MNGKEWEEFKQLIKDKSADVNKLKNSGLMSMEEARKEIFEAGSIFLKSCKPSVTKSLAIQMLLQYSDKARPVCYKIVESLENGEPFYQIFSNDGSRHIGELVWTLVEGRHDLNRMVKEYVSLVNKSLGIK